MADPNVGQAIALQTRATPYTGAPITTGLRLNQANLLKQAEIEARRETKEQKRRDMLSKYTAIKPVSGIHSAFTKDNLKLAQEANFALTDPTLTPAEKEQLKATVAGEMILRANYGKQLNDFGNYVKNRQNLTYRGLGDFTNIAVPDDLKAKAAKYDDEDRLIMSGAFDFDPNGIPVVSTPLKRVNVSDVFTKALSRATGLSEFDIVGRTKNFSTVKQDLDKKSIDSIVENLVIDDPNLAYQLRFDNEALTKKIIREERVANPSISEDELMLNVDRRLAKEIGSKYYFDKYGIRTNPQDGGGSGYNVAGKSFNPSLQRPEQNIDAYVAAGVLTPEQVAYYKNAKKVNPALAEEALLDVPDILAIDPPNTGTFTIKDAKGKTFKADNLKAIYVPKTQNGGGGKWFMSGSKQENGINTPVLIPINEYTYGNLISVYGKMTTKDIEKLLNKRMVDGGIENDEFVLDVLRPNNDKQSKPIKSGSVRTKVYDPVSKKFILK